ncbi:Tobamovirus multiplication protein like [Heracleum sosnowskyi]|uniref:Tobamovirus multiplication protein like n=1 Tax=Heracleum sosnowskyi TaxID=360622 RepID=A0AAD8HKL0_9APIA|nr:Tobamovirus multiplication protein like [Heracleum sosnowskyi]
MLSELLDSICFPKVYVDILVTVACIDALIAFLAFVQVFHLLIGISNVGYFLYFVLTLVAACKSWLCWSQSCGFVVMACPKILFLAAFLMLLSFWVDLCHQSNDDEDDDDEEEEEEEEEKEEEKEKEEAYSPSKGLLPKMDLSNYLDQRSRRYFSFRGIHVGSRQKLVIMVTVLIFILMIASAVLIWIGMGKNPIDSVFVARVYVDVFSIAMIFLGGALACYGGVLSFKMRKVRSETVSSEMLKVAGMAIVSVLCFMSSALVALFTDIPMLYHWHQHRANGVYTSSLLVMYYFVGSSVPSGFILWVMRELPSSVVKQEVTTLAFISDNTREIHPPPPSWTAATSLQNQIVSHSIPSFQLFNMWNIISQAKP